MVITHIYIYIYVYIYIYICYLICIYIYATLYIYIYIYIYIHIYIYIYICYLIYIYILLDVFAGLFWWPERNTIGPIVGPAGPKPDMEGYTRFQAGSPRARKPEP